MYVSNDWKQSSSHSCVSFVDAFSVLISQSFVATLIPSWLVDLRCETVVLVLKRMWINNNCLSLGVVNHHSSTQLVTMRALRTDDLTTVSDLEVMNVDGWGNWQCCDSSSKLFNVSAQSIRVVNHYKQNTQPNVGLQASTSYSSKIYLSEKYEIRCKWIRKTYSHHVSSEQACRQV